MAIKNPLSHVFDSVAVDYLEKLIDDRILSSKYLEQRSVPADNSVIETPTESSRAQLLWNEDFSLKALVVRLEDASATNEELRELERRYQRGGWYQPVAEHYVVQATPYDETSPNTGTDRTHSEVKITLFLFDQL